MLYRILALVAGFLTLTTLSTLPAQPVSFQATRDYLLGYARGFALGDFNTDGKPDFAVCKYDHVLFLMSDGTNKQIPSLEYCSLPLAADFNSDGWMDLVVFDIGLNQYAVLLSQGNGAFRGPLLAGAPAIVVDAATADFNLDGKADLALVLASRTLRRCMILAGNGDGTFTEKQSVDFAETPISIATGDVNGDRKLDFVVQTYSGRISAYLGNGDGSVRAGDASSTPNPDGPIAMADMNRDGRVDVITSAYDTVDYAHVSVLLMNSDGTFRAPVRYRVNFAVRAFAIGDLNGDLMPDVVAGIERVYATVLLNRGDGTLASPKPVQIPSACLEVADFDLDGKPDLAGSDDDKLGARKGTGDGSFVVTPFQPIPVSVRRVIDADFNNDGRIDLAIIGDQKGSSSTVAALMEGTGGGDFQSHVITMPDLRGIASGDFDGDGRPELVVTYSYSYGAQVDVYAVTTTWSVQLISSTYLHSHPTQLTPIDFNGDGKLDLLVPDEGPFYSFWALIGDGTGAFQPVKTESSSPLTAIVAGDLNHDSYADAVALTTAGSLSIWLGRGDGGFANPVEYPDGPSSLSLADFNQDGILDVAGVVNEGFSVYIGNGDGTLQPPRLSRMALDKRSYPMIGDFNNDQRLDIAFVASGAQVPTGNGDGTFADSPVRFVAPQSSAAICSDFNRDGKLDILFLGISATLLVNTTGVQAPAGFW